jgi:hypothetical protein
MSEVRAPSFVAADEELHPADPGDWSWNESFYFSWIDLDRGPAGFFRVGVLPNQGRAMVWCFVHAGGDGAGGEWLAIEESRLDLDDVDLTRGVAYDAWALQFAWHPEPPLQGARFSFSGAFLARTGPRAGAVVPVSLELVATATSDCFGTGTDDDRADQTTFPARSFEQSLTVSGSAVIDGRRYEILAGGHRDRSWGPREWRRQFTLGDLQSPDGQLYFVGVGPGLGIGYLRDESGAVRHLGWSGGGVNYDDDARTIGAARLELSNAEGVAVEAELTPIAPSVCFDMAHTCAAPEHWLYWRTLVEARVSGWDAPCRGWVEASRYGC